MIDLVGKNHAERESMSQPAEVGVLRGGGGSISAVG